MQHCTKLRVSFLALSDVLHSLEIILGMLNQTNKLEFQCAAYQLAIILRFSWTIRCSTLNSSQAAVQS